MLVNRAVEAGVFEHDARGMLSEGLAYDRCKVGVVTNIDPDELVLDFYIDDVEKLIKVIRTQVDVILPDGVAVLNAADQRVVDLAPLCDGEVMYYGLDPDLPVLAAQRGNGGRSQYAAGRRHQERYSWPAWDHVEFLFRRLLRLEL